MTTLELQRALTVLGYRPGPVDGVFGRKTIAAVKAFQKAKGLVVDGIVGPVTRGALVSGLSAEKVVGIIPVSGRPFTPWLDEVKRRQGLHELRNKSSLMAWLRSDGATLGDPSKLPWCGDLVQTAIALTLPEESLPANPYLARNWLKFGVPCEPTIGAVLVFWRGSRNGISGHVGFYGGEDATHFTVWGGNQRNSICTARLGKDRLLGARWPSTVPLGGVLKAAGDKGAVVTTNEA